MRSTNTEKWDYKKLWRQNYQSICPNLQIRSALGDLKQAEATLRSLSHSIHPNPQVNPSITSFNTNNNNNNNNINNNNQGQSNTDPACIIKPNRTTIQKSFKKLAKHLKSLKNLKDGFIQLSNLQDNVSIMKQLSVTFEI